MNTLWQISFLDASTPRQAGFQDPATPIIGAIIHFHNYLIFILILIASIVIWLLYVLCTAHRFNPTKYTPAHSDRGFTHSTVLEVIWTLTPALILLIIAMPSFALLYSMDELVEPSLTLKVVGHQWYWSYEYSDYEGDDINFDSYMVGEDDLPLGGLRLLEVDHRVVLPVNTHIRVLVTAADVLHSWAVPSLGVKVDACPGRLNQTSMFMWRQGCFYGQCSEICGVNHGFMPIVVEAVSLEDYVSWLETKI